MTITTVTITTTDRKARRQALAAADDALPDVPDWEAAARSLHLGRQLLTDDGWQTIRGLLMFDDADQVSVFTDERDDVSTNGWQFHLEDTVRTRNEPGEDALRRQRHRTRQAARQARRQAMTAAACPDWCVEHYDGGARREQRNHSGTTHSVDARTIYSGEPEELGFWLEKRHDRETGVTETVGVVEVRLFKEDIELAPADMRRLASKLMSLADTATMHR